MVVLNKVMYVLGGYDGAKAAPEVVFHCAEAAENPSGVLEQAIEDQGKGEKTGDGGKAGDDDD